MGRICAFCGRGPVTAEHVWPEWIVKQFPITRIRVHRTARSTSSYPEKSIKLTTRFVCEGCNSGWMSDIENRIKPVLLQMIKGLPVLLGGPEQGAVAAWAIKTAMVFEFTLGGAPSTRYWSHEERVAFAKPPHDIPGETVVTTAAFQGSLLAYSFAGNSGVISIAGTGPVLPGTRTTLVVGRLVLQVESNRWKSETGREGWVWPTPHGDQAEWISPQQHAVIEWPPASPLDDSALRVFAGQTPRRS